MVIHQMDFGKIFYINSNEWGYLDGNRFDSYLQR